MFLMTKTCRTRDKAATSRKCPAHGDMCCRIFTRPKAVRAGAWTTAYGCIDKADFDPLIGLVTLISGGLLGFAAWLGKNTNVLRAAPHEVQKAKDRQEMIR